MPYCCACGAKLETGECFCSNCGENQQGNIMPFASRRPTQGTLSKYHFGVMGVVALAFIIVIVILLATPGIYGRYYAEYEGDNIIMVIEKDGTLTLSVAGESVGGTWRIEDNAILLMVEGESMYRGRMDGNRIEVYDPETGEKVLAFTRQSEMPRQAEHVAERIRFQSGEHGQHTYVINPDGTGKDRLISNPLVRGHLNLVWSPDIIWSPDNKRVVYFTVDRMSMVTMQVDKGSMHLMNSDGTSPIELKYDWDFRPPDVRWSPDSRRIAFWHRGDFYIINHDGTNEIKLDEVDLSFWSWSPDSRKIAIVNEYQNLILINSDGTGKVRLVPEVHVPTEGPFQWTPIRWAPDGQRILYLKRCRLNGLADYVIGVDGQGKIALGGNAAQWSPTGERVAYILHESRSLVVPKIAEIGKLGTVTQRWGSGINFCNEFSWSPDGEKIMFRTYGLGSPSELGYFIFNIRTGKTYHFGLDRSRLITTPVWSPDGDRVIFTQDGYIYHIQSGGTGEIKIGKEGGEISNPQWSPDGQKIVYQFTEKFGKEILGEYIYVIGADGTGKQRLAEGTRPAWLPGSR